MQYVEISARGTGKTSRLVTTVYAYVRDKIRCVIHTPNISMAEELRSRLAEEYAEYFYVLPTDYGRVNADMESGVLDYVNAHHFYDEFDYILHKSLKHKNFFFVGTPRYIRTEANKSDFLFQLLKHEKVNGKYVVFTHTDVFRPMIDYLGSMNKEQYKCEILGQYFEPKVNV